MNKNLYHNYRNRAYGGCAVFLFRRFGQITNQRDNRSSSISIEEFLKNAEITIHIQRANLFTYNESELLELERQLIDPKQNEYGYEELRWEGQNFLSPPEDGMFENDVGF